jgi:vacuolar-type H+-ATPase subunit H
VDERPENAAPGAAAPPRDYTEVGERVAAVLNAAEEAASRIRADAETEARGIVDERREAAELEVKRLLNDAKADAEAIRDAAEAAARRIAEVGQQRFESLRLEARALEGRFETAVDDLRDLTAQLEDVVVGAAHRENPVSENDLSQDLWPETELSEAASPEDGRPPLS